MRLERSKRFDLDTLIQNVPSLRQVAEAYHGNDTSGDALTTKRNRHISITARKSSVRQEGSSVHSEPIAGQLGSVSNRAQSIPKGRLQSLVVDRSSPSNLPPTLNQKENEAAVPPSLSMFRDSKLPSLRSTMANTSALRTEATNSPKKVKIISMDGVKKQGRHQRSKTQRGAPVASGETLSGEDALKQYYDKMFALELKLKNDLE